MNIRDLLALSLVSGVGTQRLRALIDHFGDPSDAFRADPAELKSIPSIDRKTAINISSSNPDNERIDEILRKLDSAGGRIITFRDTDYPGHLREIYDPPVFLYMLGSLIERDHDSIAVVGTRNPTSYGKKVTESICSGLANAGFTIVSGLARGIDAVAHDTAVKCGARTIAVTGSGLDIVYPQDNIRISHSIRRGGAVLSEYHMGTKPEAGNFPKRNRIISGMTLGTVVIESSDTGGAMITASYALDQNREIFAVPGQITERRSNGTNKLIQQGRAKLVRNHEDIIEEVVSKLKYTDPLSAPDIKPSLPPDLNSFERKLYDVLNGESLHIDEAARLSGLSTSDALVHLLSLEFKGLVKQLAGKIFKQA